MYITLKCFLLIKFSTEMHFAHQVYDHTIEPLTSLQGGLEWFHHWLEVRRTNHDQSVHRQSAQNPLMFNLALSVPLATQCLESPMLSATIIDKFLFHCPLSFCLIASEESN